MHLRREATDIPRIVERQKEELNARGRFGSSFVTYPKSVLWEGREAGGCSV